MKPDVCINALSAAVASAVFATSVIAAQPERELELIEVIGHKLTLINQDTPASISVLTDKKIARQQQALISLAVWCRWPVSEFLTVLMIVRRCSKYRDSNFILPTAGLLIR